MLRWSYIFGMRWIADTIGFMTKHDNVFNSQFKLVIGQDMVEIFFNGSSICLIKSKFIGEEGRQFLGGLNLGSKCYEKGIQLHISGNSFKYVCTGSIIFSGIISQLLKIEQKLYNLFSKNYVENLFGLSLTLTKMHDKININMIFQFGYKINQIFQTTLEYPNKGLYLHKYSYVILIYLLNSFRVQCSTIININLFQQVILLFFDLILQKFAQKLLIQSVVQSRNISISKSMLILMLILIQMQVYNNQMNQSQHQYSKAFSKIIHEFNKECLRFQDYAYDCSSLFQNLIQEQDYSTSFIKQNFPKRQQTTETTRVIHSQQKSLSNPSQSIQVQLTMVNLRNQVLRGSKNDTMELCINFKTLLTIFFRELETLNELSDKQIDLINQFNRRSPSLKSMAFFFKQNLVNKNLIKMAKNLFSSSCIIRRILKSRCNIKNKLQMIKFIEKMRINTSKNGSVTKWKDQLIQKY